MMAHKTKKAVGGNQAAFNKLTYQTKHTTFKSHRQFFDKKQLPEPFIFYQTIFRHFKVSGQWAQTLCCFHDDHHPSFFLNIKTGAFKCFACGERGGDILDFYQKYHCVDFKTAAKALGAWRD